MTETGYNAKFSGVGRGVCLSPQSPHRSWNVSSSAGLVCLAPNSSRNRGGGTSSVRDPGLSLAGSVTDGRNRPISLIGANKRERRIPDRKEDITHEMVIVHRCIQRDRPPFDPVANIGWTGSLGHRLAM
jgi:hypothetical protein